MSIKEIFYTIFGADKKPVDTYDCIRDQKVYIRVTQDEKEIIQKLANCQCLDKSNFIRWLIFSKYVDDFIKIN